jgi:hypothetical protein
MNDIKIKIHTKLEDEFFVQINFVSPQHSTQTRINQTKLMTRGVYRNNSGKIKAPFDMGIRERRNESPRSSIDMYGYVKTSAFLKVVH